MVQILFIFVSGPDPDFIHFEFGFVSRFYPFSQDPGPDFINGESGSKYGFHSTPDPHCIYFSVRVRMISSKSGSVPGSGFYPFGIRVQILSNISGSGSAFGLY